MNKVANQIGYLVIKEDGAVLESGGELENDERSANIFLDLIHLTESVDENFIPSSSCERLSIVYQEHMYNICMSNRRIYVVKLRTSAPRTSAAAAGGSNGAVYLEPENIPTSAVLT